MSGALIITAGLADADQARFDRLRRTHYPADRNQLPAHLTLFHALPPSAEGEVTQLLKQLARASPPPARTAGLLNLGRGVAVRIVSDDLTSMRDEIADHFHGLLTSQDQAGWRPHITIQNKVEPAEARVLVASLDEGWADGAVRIAALELHHYLGGPWEMIGRYPFRG